MNTRQVGRTDLRIDTLGLGGAPLGGNFVDLDDSEAAELVRTAQEIGIGYFDTAPWYGFGRSERVIGDALRGTEYILSDKVGRLLKPGAVENPMDFGMVDPLPFNVVYDYSYDGIMRAYEDSLQRLGLDRIDMLFAHDIGEMQHGAENARHFKDLADGGYRAMDELRRNGDVKAIGLGVNENKICLNALGIGAWDVFLLAGRYTLLEQTPLEGLFPACRAAGTTIICGGPFNSGILAGRDMWNYAKAPEDVVAKVRKLSAEADAFGVPLPAAALQFPLGNDIVTSVIPGPRNTAELRQIVEWFEMPIPADFWASLRDKGLIAEAAPVPAGA
ncbi:aldo/keto reductase [Ponticoccus sp. SC2-23]|uniref:aldo/keto reductase n=1 Tax=Alexandriicola marinus TaxID=2081710 RepID=UPI000FDA28A7|nr:aldo/keto reductase [Alexandriicola marinus]MBM1218708.1 aldo/keto reductase [Ponticoccus sp. SC6-9]MBM1224220.1 aldo/keto reductase [Ponticoccus sp. SC6-15]MBM1230001.1 aldo/keto reductase [Ponticoccus sp. SC6-38]MBM1233186.1 aldo/keto reductase [Ponticoccus sp. SC6-45]MBM1236864.1 aldo/keto reductase [Ponticoccus sp. SC6-49]MBM1242197.1 aldo/keto reductase [Ponticoccus sp. SC2-64]MBM1246710.1 aldo/keto reductase [Ponticoccus sp. SC6-42]MBM1251188.1 aldo/keto reductase [Ponticoccus sp. 